MTTLFLISSEGHFGAENMLVELACGLSRLGCRCLIGVFQDARHPHTEVAEHARKQGLAVELIACKGRCDLSVVHQIRSLIAKHDVDIIHSHGYKADLYARLGAWPSGVALVATCHNWPNKLPRMRAYAVLDRMVLRRFDRVVVISDEVEQTILRSGLPSNKVVKIFNGVDHNRFDRRDEGCCRSDTRIGFVGRLVPGKGGTYLLCAAQKVLEVHPEATFVIVGDGPARGEWMALAKQLGISDRVVFTGVQNDMPAVYASMGMLVLPSLCEAMPMCVLEGMAAGKPIVATRVGAVPQVVINNETGLLVSPANVDELATAILQILGDEAFANRLGGNARLRVAEHFSADAMARRYYDTYREALQAGRFRKKAKRATCETV
jgi:glycosyltransferase involved in cell wall biosynthesis